MTFDGPVDNEHAASKALHHEGGYHSLPQQSLETGTEPTFSVF